MKYRRLVAGALFGAAASVVTFSGLFAPRGSGPASLSDSVLTGARAQAIRDGRAVVDAFSLRAAEAADGPVLQDAWPGLKFTDPISVGAANDGTDRMFVAMRGGKIEVMKKWRGTGPAPAAATFLDISSLQQADAIDQGQGGLLSIAVHPKFKTDGRIFVFYGTLTPQAVIASYRVSKDNPDRADPASGQIVMTVDKVHTAHYGGGLAFGPDGKLYIGFGDSGIKVKPGEVQETDSISQNVRRIDGKILRIDVDGKAPYAIPADNPWATAGNGVRGEIWAYGIRNPWRFTFDREGGAMWLGDPGQSSREEVSVVPRAGNMGWPYREGSKPLMQGTAPADLVAPVFDYAREMGHCVIGGCVYRGQRCASLKGQYLFADYTANKIFAMPVSGNRSTGAPRELAAFENCVSINEDAEGELYFVSLDGGKIQTLVPAP